MPAPQLSNEPWDEHLIRYGMPFASRLIAKARGTLIWDSEGREILDFTSGQMCATLGHNHPRIVEAIHDACEGALHLYSGMLSPPVVALSQRLTALLPPHLSKALFLSTGAEANEAALKLAKLHSGRYEVVGFTGAWHGMTSGALAVNYVAGRQGYGPTIPGALALPAPNAYRCPIRHCRDRCDGTCLEVGFDLVDAQSTGSLAAVIAEPIESSGGVIVPPDGYWQRVKEHCERARHAPDLRRGPDRVRPPRPRLRLPAFRRRARHAEPLQDPGRRPAALGDGDLGSGGSRLPRQGLHPPDLARLGPPARPGGAGRPRRPGGGVAGRARAGDGRASGGRSAPSPGAARSHRRRARLRPPAGSRTGQGPREPRTRRRHRACDHRPLHGAWACR